MAKHGTVSAAAKALFLSRHTVDAEIDQLRGKTGLRKIAQLVAWAAANGYLADEEANEQE